MKSPVVQSFLLFCGKLDLNHGEPPGRASLWFRKTTLPEALKNFIYSRAQYKKPRKEMTGWGLPLNP